MGQRGADREPATDEDLAKMRALAKEAIEVGALGFASSRFAFHKTAGGAAIPSYDAGRDEIDRDHRGHRRRRGRADAVRPRPRRGRLRDRAAAGLRRSR